MPVQADEIDGAEISAVEVSADGAGRDPGDGGQAGDDVQAVQAGHHEIDAEKDAGVSRAVIEGRVGVAGIGVVFFQGLFGVLVGFELSCPEQAVLPLVLVFDVFDTQKAAAAEESQAEEYDQAGAVVSLAQRTAQAMVKLLAIRTAVLMPPRVLSRNWWAQTKISGWWERKTAYAQNRPEKRRISVRMKIHMPSFPASNCWECESKWCARKGACSAEGWFMVDGR